MAGTQLSTKVCSDQSYSDQHLFLLRTRSYNKYQLQYKKLSQFSGTSTSNAVRCSANKNMLVHYSKLNQGVAVVSNDVRHSQCTIVIDRMRGANRN